MPTACGSPLTTNSGNPEDTRAGLLDASTVRSGGHLRIERPPTGEITSTSLRFSLQVCDDRDGVPTAPDKQHPRATCRGQHANKLRRGTC